MRRIKQDVAKDLPERVISVVPITLSAQEREVYEVVRNLARKEVQEKVAGGGAVFSILESVLRLRQACSHLGLLPKSAFGGDEADTIQTMSSKLDYLTETCLSIQSQGGKTLVFSQWTSFLDLIAERFEEVGVRPLLRIDGQTKDRQQVVDEFQQGVEPCVLLMSLKAGGTGLNLTAADHVFLCDPWWNPAAERQAIDRAHRIGRESTVMVHKIVASDTIEEAMLRLQESKEKLASGVGVLDPVEELSTDELVALI